jgi:hypothetical protein
MTAPALLETLRRSGVSVHSDGGALTLDGPGAVIDSLLPEVARFKLALLELLTAPEPPATDGAAKWRRANEFVFVPAKVEPAPGAAKICEVLQSFRLLFAAARGGDLPQQPLEMEIAGEVLEVENAAAAVLNLEIAWTKAARQCQKEKRDLTEVEAGALGAVAELLNHVWARFDGPGAAAWLDLKALNAALDADLKAMHQKQRATQKPSEATP